MSTCADFDDYRGSKDCRKTEHGRLSSVDDRATRKNNTARWAGKREFPGSFSMVE